MDSSWKYFYKLSTDNQTTNMLYTALVNEEENTFCMLWDETSPYQHGSNDRLTKDLVDFFFEREVKYLSKFQNKNWAVKIKEIDLKNRKIFIEWNSNTLHRIINDPLKDLSILCPDWKDQIFNILKDITDEGLYKMALYPHCFFLDNNNTIKTFDFYSCLEVKERFLPREKINGIIGKGSGMRFDEATTEDNCIDFDIFFKNTLQNHLGNTWPDNPFPEFYQKLYLEK